MFGLNNLVTAGKYFPEIIILGSIFKRRLVVAFVVTVFIVAVAAGYIADAMGIVPLPSGVSGGR